LARLAERLASEQAQVLAELESLRKNVGHIKEIVAIHQNYARTSGVIDNIEVTELIEDTLRMNAGAFAHEQVRLVREYSFVPDGRRMAIKKAHPSCCGADAPRTRTNQSPYDLPGRYSRPSAVRLTSGGNPP
jgi:hypothetical protein